MERDLISRGFPEPASNSSRMPRARRNQWWFTVAREHRCLRRNKSRRQSKGVTTEARSHGEPQEFSSILPRADARGFYSSSAEITYSPADISQVTLRRLGLQQTWQSST